jgi:hypothetical protein
VVVRCTLPIIILFPVFWHSLSWKRSKHGKHSGRAETFDAVDPAHTLESSISTISWTAIIGGAFAAAALSLILLLSGLASAWLQCHHGHILELR